MKTSELKKLIGKEIEWIDYYDVIRGSGIKRTALLLDVKGFNLYVDFNGTNDWLWSKDLRFIKEHTPGE